MERIQPDPKGGFRPVGEAVEVNTDRQLNAESEFDQRVRRSQQFGNHLWIVAVVHFATDQMLDAFSGESDEMPMLDHETIAQRPGIVCWNCAQPFNSRIRNYKCKATDRGQG